MEICNSRDSQSQASHNEHSQDLSHSRPSDATLVQNDCPDQSTAQRDVIYVDDEDQREGSSRRRLNPNDRYSRQRLPIEITEAAVQRHPTFVKVYQYAKCQVIRVRKLEDELASIKDALQREQSAHRLTQRALEEKVSELQGANEFLSQTDHVSCADVIGMAESLNFDIQQVAAQIASTYGTFDVSGERSNREAHKAQASVSKKLGFDLSKVAQNTRIKDDEGLRGGFVEFMIQAILVNYVCFDVLDNRWSTQPDLDKALAIIYDRIANEESTAIRPIAGKWRTLTHTVSHEELSTERLVETSLHYARRVLIAFGAINVPSEEEFRSLFRGDIESIITNLLKLDTTIKEKISSCIIRPWVPESDSRADWKVMADINSPESQVGEEFGPPILSTVALGLYKTDNAGQSATLLLKAQVVLETLVPGLGIRQGAEEAEDQEVEEIIMS